MSQYIAYYIYILSNGWGTIIKFVGHVSGIMIIGKSVNDDDNDNNFSNV